MKFIFIILVLTILTDRDCNPTSIVSDYASAKQSTIGVNTEFTMDDACWIKIPNFPFYEFNPNNLEVRFIGRTQKISNQFKADCGYRDIKKRILKPQIHRQGYRQYNLSTIGQTKNILRHQISWLVEYGELPPTGTDIDHIDGDVSNDHIWNLQLLSHRDNNAKGWASKKKSGLSTGVYKYHNKFGAQITLGKKHIHLGLFITASDASQAYQNAKLNISGT